MQGFAVSTAKRDVLTGITPVIQQAVCDGSLQGRRTLTNVVQPPTDDAAAADGEKIFTCRIQVANALRLINQEHR